MTKFQWLRDWPWLAAGLLMLGIYWGDAGRPDLLLGGAAPLLLLAALRPRYCYRALLLSLCLLTGFGRGDLQKLPEPNARLDSSNWKDHKLEGAGWILNNPRRNSDSVSFWLWLERVEGHPQVAPLPIFVQVRPNQHSGSKEPPPLPAVALGQRWRVQGRLDALGGGFYPGDYDRARELGRHGMASGLRVSWGLDQFAKLEQPRSRVLRLRLRLQAAYKELLPTREAALLTGVVLGDPQELDEPLQLAFQQTGTSHLLAASGANVALVVAIALGVGGLLGYGPKPLAWPCLLLGLTYMGLAGFASSIVRAGWMAVFALGARALGREAAGGRCLALGVLANLLFDPTALFDIGFQLSAGAVLSLVLLEEPLRRCLPPIPRLDRAVASGIAVLYGLAPLFVYHFQELNLAGLLGNLLIAVPVEALLPVGLVQGAAALLPGPAALWMSHLTGPWARADIAWVEYLAQHLQPHVLARPDGWCLAAWLLGLMVLLGRPPRWLWALLGWTCLLASDPRLPEGWSRCRLVSRYGKTMLWWAGGDHPDILVVEEAKQLSYATGMLRKHGCLQLETPMLLGEGPDIVLQAPALRIEHTAGALEIRRGRFRLLWKSFAKPNAGDLGATVLVGGRLRRLRQEDDLYVRLPQPLQEKLIPLYQSPPDPSQFDLGDAPLEIWTDGVSVRSAAWKD